MSTAKELFKVVGYEKAEKSESVVLYTNRYGDTISFTETKHVIITPIQGCRTIIMTCFLENAIHKQCEELGWIKKKPKHETNLDHYKNEIKYAGYEFALVNGKPTTCRNSLCDQCYFNDKCLTCDRKRMEWMLKPFKRKYQLTQFEYDLLNAYKNSGMRQCISNYSTLLEMYGKGHFKSIDTSTQIHEILDNCEVMD